MSDPARPETAGRAALVELEAVIRNVTDQLVVFRRRALSAESQLRDFEQVTAQAAKLAQGADVAGRRIAALEQALAMAEQAAVTAQAAAAEAVTQAQAQAHAQAAAASVAIARAAERSTAQSRDQAPLSGSADAELASENAALRERLVEAAERSRQISERVRFLRQQIGNGSEK